MRGYKPVSRCKDCGKIYDKGIPYICSKCGAEIGKPTPTILQMMGCGEVTLTEKCEKVVAKKGLFGWKVREPQITEMKLTDLFKEYKKFVARNMDTYGRKVEWDESPEYEAMTVFFEFEKDRERSWSSFKYATIDFTVDEEEQQEELNRTIRLSKWNGDRKDGWEIRVDTNPNLNSLRNLDAFDLLLLKLQRADVRIIADELSDEDDVYSDTKPEPTYE